MRAEKDIRKCPNCVGGHLFVLNRNSPLLPCGICNGTGILPDDITFNPERGQDLKERRRALQLTLRQFCRPRGVDVVVRSEQERGFFRKVTG